MGVIFNGKTINNNYKITKGGIPQLDELYYSVDLANYLGLSSTALTPSAQYTIDMDEYFASVMESEYPSHRSDIVYTYSNIVVGSPELFHWSLQHTFLETDLGARSIAFEAPETYGNICNVPITFTVSAFDPVSNETTEMSAYAGFYFMAMTEEKANLYNTGLFSYVGTNSFTHGEDEYSTEFEMAFTPFYGSNIRFGAYQSIMGDTSSQSIAENQNTQQTLTDILSMGATFSITGVSFRGSGSVDGNGIYTGTYGPLDRPYEQWVELQEGEITFSYEGYEASYPFTYQVDGVW